MSLLADLVLILHAVFIGFVVFGMLLILLGGALRWRWVRNRWFRIAHLLAIGIVVLQAWFGITCPLTTLENLLRESAGQAVYEQGFIADHLHRLIFFNAPMWVFTLAYSVFGLLVVSGLWLVPPTWHSRNRYHKTVEGQEKDD